MLASTPRPPRSSRARCLLASALACSLLGAASCVFVDDFDGLRRAPVVAPEDAGATDAASADAAAPDASHGCAGDGDCEAPLPRCHHASSTCVACLPATEAVDCPGDTCSAVTHACSDVAPGSVGNCEPCTADSQCMSGSACVPTEFDGQPLGGRCLQRTSLGCPSATGRLVSATSLSGVTDEFCAPGTLTTCDAVLDYLRQESCQIHEDCGATGVADGLCRESGPRVCSYACTVSAECGGRQCEGEQGCKP